MIKGWMLSSISTWFTLNCGNDAGKWTRANIINRAVFIGLNGNIFSNITEWHGNMWSAIVRILCIHCRKQVIKLLKLLCYSIKCAAWPTNVRCLQGTGSLMPWWSHQMQSIFRVAGPLCGESPVTSEFPSQKPVTRNFDVFFDLRLNKRLNSKQ